MREEIEFRWLTGKVNIHGISELSVIGDGWQTIFSQRDIKLEGIVGAEEEFDIHGSNLKHVYIQFNEQLVGLKNGHFKSIISDSARHEIGFFEVRYTVLGGKLFFLTIVPIYGALYDYAILTPNELYLRTIGRRRIFVKTEERNMIIYLL
jgi:hypothetical protein